MNATIAKYPCDSCHESVPSDARFCPFCGSDRSIGANADTNLGRSPAESPRLAAVTRFEAQRDLTPIAPRTEEESPIDEDLSLDLSSGRRRTAIAAGLGACAILLLSGIVVIVGYGGSQDEEVADASAPPDRVSVAGEAGPEAVPHIYDGEFEVTFAGDGSSRVAEVRYDGSPVFEIATAEGSRYDELTRRANAVRIRLDHVAKLTTRNPPVEGRFRAVSRTGRHEVVWFDGTEHPFRVLDVTARDVEAWNHRNGTATSTAILANLIADELNARSREATRAQPTT